MQSERRFGITLVSFSVAASISVCTVQSAFAQGGVLSRIEARRAAREQNDNPSQNTNGVTNAAPGNGAPVNAQFAQGNPQPSDVSMVTLQTQTLPSGEQMVITPKGYAVPLPGPGVAGGAVQIYMGARGGYWYVDRNGQQVDLTSAVQRYQAGATQNVAPAQYTPPQYAPPPQQYAQQPQQQSSGANAMVTATAAGLGAMAGAAMTGSTWNNVPYGTPIHYGAAAVPYYNQGGKPVYINNSSVNNAVAVNDVNKYHATAVNQQEAWYHAQQAQQTSAYRGWQQPMANPFVASGYSSEYGAAAGATAAHYGAQEGQQAARYGAAAGAGAAHYGAQEGQQAARFGAAEGAGAAHYGAQEGQQAARYGAAEGAGAAHYGAQEGQQAARYGAAEGAGAAHHGAEEGQQAARMGAAEGAGAASNGSEGRFGGDGKRFGGGDGARDGGRFGGSEARGGGRRGR